MKKVFYIGNYDVDENKIDHRGIALSGRNKMQYICSAIERAGYCVEIISPAQTSNRESCKGKQFKISKHTTLKLFHSIGRKGIVSKILRRYWMRIQVVLYMFKNITTGSNVIVYHSLGYISMIKFLKKIKRFRLILEIEEIYGDVTGSKKDISRELKLFQRADAYIFPTELLDDKLNKEGKPSVVVYGTYQVEKQRCKFNNDNLHHENEETIHLLYAGTLDPRKGGALAAAAAAYLPVDYHIHILGFGSEQEINKMRELIKKIAEKSEARVTYDGLLIGEEYIQFVQKCQIGLSTQNSDAAFNDTSFPSKVLSYLTNGLRVISVRIEALERSAIGNLLFYYDEQTPETIAKAVREIDFSEPYDSREVIRSLDKKFIKELGELLR